LSTGAGTHIRVLDVFTDVLSQVDEHDQAEEFYNRLAEAVCRLTSMERALIFRYDSEQRRVRVAGSHEIDVSPLMGRFVTVESAPFTRRSLEEDRVVEVRHHVRDEIPEEFAWMLVPGRELVSVPIAAGGQWIGILLADRSADVPLEDEERDLLWTLGKTAALAATSRSATIHIEKAAALEQRIDMAREIHDSVIQRLFGVSLALSSGEGTWDAEDRKRAADEVGAALRDLRIAVQRPLGATPRMTGTTLADELERLAEQHPELGVALEAGDPASVPESLQPLSQSVLNEAVRNARKHAVPTQVLTRIERVDGTFVLTVSNDGVPAQGRRGAGMGQRLAALESLQHGGILEFGRPRPGWWQVKLMVPDAV
jgi:signal transduction histidine kinase